MSTLTCYLCSVVGRDEEEELIIWRLGAFILTTTMLALWRGCYLEAADDREHLYSMNPQTFDFEKLCVQCINNICMTGDNKMCQVKRHQETL